MNNNSSTDLINEILSNHGADSQNWIDLNKLFCSKLDE